jgi:hypothetical protein
MNYELAELGVPDDKSWRGGWSSGYWRSIMRIGRWKRTGNGWRGLSDFVIGRGRAG